MRRLTLLAAVIVAALGLGLGYTVLSSDEVDASRGVVYASWYDIPGGVTSSGDVLESRDWTAAHRTYPFGTRLTVCRLGGRCIYGVIVTDRGPAAWTGRALDLNYHPAKNLGIIYRGTAPVNIYVTHWGSGRRGIQY